jgi:hypothetical protein
VKATPVHVSVLSIDQLTRTDIKAKCSPSNAE